MSDGIMNTQLARWTEEEEEKLKELVSQQMHLIKDIATNFPHRTEKAVRERIRHLGLDSGREGNHWRWGEEEIAWLREVVGTDSLAQIQRKHFPNRSYNEVLSANKRFIVQEEGEVKD